jgi:hypothetical protein
MEVAFAYWLPILVIVIALILFFQFMDLSGSSFGKGQYHNAHRDEIEKGSTS